MSPNLLQKNYSVIETFLKFFFYKMCIIYLMSLKALLNLSYRKIMPYYFLFYKSSKGGSILALMVFVNSACLEMCVFWYFISDSLFTDNSAVTEDGFCCKLEILLFCLLDSRCFRLDVCRCI